MQRRRIERSGIHRLIDAQASGGTGGTYPLETYTYNAIGNILSKAGANYTYNATVTALNCVTGTPSPKPHAVSAVGSNTFTYDCNGNMLTRNEATGTYNQTWDIENRLTGVSGAGTATFVYDGDGNRVKSTVNGVTTVYVGAYYEVSGGTVKTYYYAGGQRVAMKESGALYFLLGDHLGSTALTVNGSPVALVAELRYKPWGEKRYDNGVNTPTTFRFTGQRSEEAALGSLYFYNARWYSPAVGRFLSADTIVPSSSNLQTLNRFSYTYNNPLRYTDPSGHDPIDQVWEEEFYRIHERWPTDEDRRDRFFSLLFLGSGEGGAWTDEDWTYYSAHRDELWKGKIPWRKHEPASLYRFRVHLERLASYYNAGEEERFVQAVGFIFGGLALGDPIPVLLKEATRPDRGQYQGLPEGTAGWRSELVEGRNPSHHWAGLFYAGFYLGRGQGRAVNEIRDWDIPPDLKLGELAVDFGDALYRGHIKMSDVGRFAAYTLADPHVLK